MQILPKISNLFLIISLLVFSGCNLSQSFSTQKIGFSDLHNSVISRMFTHQDLAGLESEKFAVSRSNIRNVNGNLFVFSLGINRFDMKNPETPDISEALQFLRNFRKYAHENYPDLVFAENVKHLNQLLKQGKTAYVFGLEGTHLLEDKTHYLDSLYEVGVRKITFGHRFHNQFISAPENRHKKHTKGFPALLNDNSVISDEGKKLLEKMIEKQIIIGVSHLGKTAFDEIFALNRGRTKIVAGHSNAQKICDVSRNLTDEQIKKIAENNGLIGICLHRPMLHKDKQKADLQQIIKHILHIKKLVGVNYIVFGTDLEGRITPAIGAEKLDDKWVKTLTLEMQNQGFSKREIRKILTKNLIDFYSTNL